MRLFLASVFILVAARGEALKLGPAGLKVSPSSVYMSRTITVTVELEDDGGEGSDVFWAEVRPKPARAVKLVSAEPPLSFGCTGTGLVSGRWVYRAVAPGQVKFEVVASILTCTTSLSSGLEAVSSPVDLKPVSVWSEVGVFPRNIEPREELELRLSLRNDSPVTVWFSRPNAQQDLIFARRLMVEPVGDLSVDPASALRDDRLVLPPGRLVTVSWRYRALAVGKVRFLIVGAGLIITTPSARIRPAGRLRLDFSPPDVPSAVGRDFVLGGAIHNSGAVVDIAGVAAGVDWSPRDAARLVSSYLSSTSPILSRHDFVRAEFVVKLLKPGSLVMTVTAGGREADTGKVVAADPVSVRLEIQPPPKIELKLTLDTATALVGSKVGFDLTATNHAGAAAQEMAPMLRFDGGRAEASPLIPMFRAVPAGGSASFRGVLVPEDSGVIDVRAMVTTRSDRGGEWKSFVSNSEKLVVVSVPRFEVVAVDGQERRYSGKSGSLGFVLRNVGASPVTIERVMLNLSASAEVEVEAGSQPGPVPVSLAVGESVEISVTADFPVAPAPYRVDGSAYISGTVQPYGISFIANPGSRVLTIVCPAVTALVVVEPSPLFIPRVDPLMQIEWTMTVPGEAGVAIVTSDGGLVRIVSPLQARSAGWHSVMWMGDDAAGRLVPDGKYLVRLAGADAAAASEDAVSETMGRGGMSETRRGAAGLKSMGVAEAAGLKSMGAAAAEDGMSETRRGAADLKSMGDADPAGWPARASWKSDRAFEVKRR